MIDADVDPPDAPFPKRLPAPANAPELEEGEISQDAIGRWAEMFAIERPDDPLVPELALVRGMFHAGAGAAYEEEGDRSEAIAAFRRALDLIPEDAYVIDQLVEWGELVPVENEDGETLFMEKDALADGVRQDLAMHSDEPDYLAEVADSLLGTGMADLARNAAELALASDPDHAQALLIAGVAQMQVGDPERSLAHLERHVAGTPNSAAGQVHLAYAANALGRREQAVAAAERALELDPNALPAIEVLLVGDDGPEGALSRIAALKGRLVGSWAVHRTEGDLRIATGDTDGALAAWRRAMALGADDATIAALLGELGRRGHFDELCSIADDITRLSDRDPGLRWNVAYGYELAGRMSEARIVYAQIAHDERVPSDFRQQADERADAL